jgi:hypothetical protein
LFSCEKKSEQLYVPNEKRGFFIYKIKDISYFNYVAVMVNSDVSKITATYGPLEVPEFRKCRPTVLDSGYYYEPSAIKNNKGCIFTFGDERTAIVDVKLVDYRGFNSDTMIKHIISADLFTDFYEELKPFSTNDSTTFEQDTALINSWIRKGELGKHLKRLE